jgi:hypothetical protein
MHKASNNAPTAFRGKEKNWPNLSVSFSASRKEKADGTLSYLVLGVKRGTKTL